jgi:ribosomal protein L11 methyltransferase
MRPRPYNRRVREVVLRVPKLAVEDILDRLLPIVPGGVREVPAGRHIELLIRGPHLPSLHELDQAAGRWPHTVAEREVPDDWRERRLTDYRADPIGGRLVVRPEWAPAPAPTPAPTPTPAAAPRGMIDIVLEESAAFGAGGHPTTRTCLELLLGLEPRGAFADLGCGTGVLAILARRLGWDPVLAVDSDPGSVAATAANAERNGVALDVRVCDLLGQAAPPAPGFAANVPPPVHAAIASRWRGPLPHVGLVSGFASTEAKEVFGAYAAIGLRPRQRADAHHWAVALLERP